MEWRDYQLYLLADQEKQIDTLHNTRIIAYMIYSANTSDKPRKSMEKFMPLPGDEKNEDRGEEVSFEDLKKQLAVAKAINRING